MKADQCMACMQLTVEPRYNGQFSRGPKFEDVYCPPCWQARERIKYSFPKWDDPKRYIPSADIVADRMIEVVEDLIALRARVAG